jgi:hypothetical protein
MRSNFCFSFLFILTKKGVYHYRFDFSLLIKTSSKRYEWIIYMIDIDFVTKRDKKSKENEI